MDKQSYKVKEFDLEQAKAGMLLCTRDGREVQVFDWNYKGVYFPNNTKGRYIAGKVIEADGSEALRVWELDGHIHEDRTQSELDLMMKSQKHIGYGWVLTTGERTSIFAEVYKSEADALAHHPDNANCVIAKVEWEDWE